MHRYLVVSHLTLDSPQLLDAIRDRSSAGPATFHLLVPLNHGSGFVWSEGQVLDEAERRMEEARLRLVQLGYAVSGEIGDDSPVTSVDNVLRREGPDRFEEIIVSTLPTKTSTWIGMDAPARIRRRTGIPVTHLVAAMAQH